MIRKPGLRRGALAITLAAALCLCLAAVAAATTAYKVLGQSSPSATTNTDIYTVPALTSAIVARIVVANRSTAATFRVAIRPAGAAIANAHYIAYDISVPGNDSIFLPGPFTLATTDVITVYGSSANLSFTAYGAEIN